MGEEHGHGHGHPVDRSNPAERVAEHQRHGDGVKRVPYPIRVRRLALLRRTTLTDRILRLTLGGPELAGFLSFQADDHVKVVFPHADGTRSDPTPRADVEMLHWPHPLPPTRSYTVRRHDPEAGELDLDVVVHEGSSDDEGLGSAWARDAALGSKATVAGPPSAVVFPHHRGHHVFAVDETGLPTVGRWLDEAPADVSADVVVEAGARSDLDYPLAELPGVRVHPLVRGGTSRLADAIRELERPDAFLFAAGEADAVKPLRRAARAGLVGGALVTGYWKLGAADHDED